MARPLRIEYAGALYHVVSRGDRRESIVEDDADRERRLWWLARTVGQHNWLVHAFVLMTNHEHLFIETPEPNLSAGMKLLNGAYTQYFNKRHRRSGHLFQGRYKAHVVENDAYFGELSRYIHLNPVRAKFTPRIIRPEDYRWSSFPGYVREPKQLDWVTYDRVLADFGPGRRSLRRRRYGAYVRAGLSELPERPWKHARHGMVIGSEEFVEQVKQKLAIKSRQMNVPQSEAFIIRPSLEVVLTTVAKEYGANRTAWAPGRRSQDASRSLAAYLARHVYGYSGKIVADAMGYRDGGGVTHAVRQVESSRKLIAQARRLEKRILGSLIRK